MYSSPIELMNNDEPSKTREYTDTEEKIESFIEDYYSSQIIHTFSIAFYL